MKPDTIKAIFTNILFVIGIGLLIFGFINGSLTTSRVLTLDRYPLPDYEENRCEYDFPRPIMIEKEAGVPTPGQESEEEWQERKQKCLDTQERQRKIRKTNDIVTSVSTLVTGSVLVYSFRKYILK